MMRWPYAAMLLVLACGQSGGDPGTPPVARLSLLLNPADPEWRKPAPALSHLRFETTKGAFVLELHRDWGPIGADRVYNLARRGYYDDTRLHRVRADIVHFGIHGDPRVNAVWSKAELRDDPPRSTNRPGTFALAFPARPDSRTTQIYINKTDNARSDPEAFTVLGTVVEGMDVVHRLYAGYGEGSGGGMRQGKQGPLLEGGNAFMDTNYPLLDRILRVVVAPMPESPLIQQARNAYSCLPSLTDPPDQMVLFKDGTYTSPSIPFAEMRASATGTLDGAPVVVSEIVWNTGGSGNWEIVVLFRGAKGKVVFQGVYSPAAELPDGGTMVGRIEVRQNKVYLYGEDPLHHRTITKPLIVTASVFERCRIEPG